MKAMEHWMSASEACVTDMDGAGRRTWASLMSDDISLTARDGALTQLTQSPYLHTLQTFASLLQKGH